MIPQQQSIYKKKKKECDKMKISFYFVTLREHDEETTFSASRFRKHKLMHTKSFTLPRMTLLFDNQISAHSLLTCYSTTVHFEVSGSVLFNLN